MSNLAKRGEFMPPAAWAQINEMAAKLSASGALPPSIKNGAQLGMVFLAGFEAGMTPMESVQSFYIVNGRVTIFGDAVPRQLKRAGYKVTWNVVSAEEASVTITAPDGQTYTESFTIEEAKQAGLLSKDNWIKYPKDMLRWKCLGRAVRFFCPEVLFGTYIKEDIEAEIVDVQPPKNAPVVAPPTVVDATITPEQLSTIAAATKELGMDVKVFDAWVFSSFKKKLPQISVKQGDAVIAKLNEQIAAKRAQQAEDDKLPQPPEPPATPVVEAEVVAPVDKKPQDDEVTIEEIDRAFNPSRK